MIVFLDSAAQGYTYRPLAKIRGGEIRGGDPARPAGSRMRGSVEIKIRGGNE